MSHPGDNPDERDQVWSLGFVPGKPHPTDVENRIAQLISYARHCTGLKLLGVRIGLVIEQEGAPMANRIRRVLKHAGRSLGLKCVDMKINKRPRKSLPEAKICDDEKRGGS